MKRIRQKGHLQGNGLVVSCDCEFPFDSWFHVKLMQSDHFRLVTLFCILHTPRLIKKRKVLVNVI